MNQRISNLIFVFICILIVSLTFKNGVQNMMKWDAFGYYIYLPLIFDQNNLVLTDLDYIEHLRQTENISPTLYQFVQSENGSFFTKYTCGWAILMLPFYTIAEIWARIGGHESNGFTFPYQTMVHIGSLFYLILGLYFTRKLLKHFFSIQLSNVLVLVLVLGTNLLFMSYASTTITHHFALLFVTISTLRIIRFHENPSIKNAILLGISIGILTAVRPPDVLIVFLFFLWNLKSFGGIIAKTKWFIQTQKIHLFIILLSFLIVLLPQFIYWKSATDSYLIDSYSNNAGEGFDIFNPHILEFLFSFRKGWFLYTPIALLSIFGFMVSKNKNSKSTLFFILLFIFMASTWTTWWYAGSYSQRAAVDIYPLMIIGLGFLIVEFKAKRIAVFSIITVLYCFNLFQTYQMEESIIHDSRMTKNYYSSVFGQISSPTKNQLSLLLKDKNELIIQGFRGNNYYYKVFSNFSTFKSDSTVISEKLYGPDFTFCAPQLISTTYAWIKVTFQFSKTKSSLEGTIFFVNSKYKDKPYAWRGFETKNKTLKIDYKKNTVSFAYLTPDFRTKKDLVSIGIWKPSGPPTILLNRTIEIFIPKYDPK